MPQLFVKKKLNKRSKIPTTLPQSDGIVEPVPRGHRFWGTLVKGPGLPPPPLDKWYQDEKGFYYWAEAIDEISDFRTDSVAVTSKISFDPNKMSWGHKRYDLPFVWDDLKTAGQNVTVAVIDTGVDINHLDLKSRIHPSSKSFISDDKSIIDINGHGTCMAGIIAADGSNKVYGVAPEAKLLIVKGSLEKAGANLIEFANAINYAASIPDVDIISISYSFLEIITIQDPEFEQAISNCIAAGKIIVCSIGNAHHGNNPDLPTFPACYNKEFPNRDNILSIGAFNEHGLLCSFSNWSNHLRCLAPGERILTTQKGNQSVQDTGSSIATAFTTGCLALLISYSKLNNKPISKCIPAILDSCDDLGETIGYDEKSGYGLINFRNAISKIK